MKAGTKVMLQGWSRVGTIVKIHNAMQCDVEWAPGNGLEGYTETLCMHNQTLVVVG